MVLDYVGITNLCNRHLHVSYLIEYSDLLE